MTFVRRPAATTPRYPIPSLACPPVFDERHADPLSSSMGGASGAQHAWVDKKVISGMDTHRDLHFADVVDISEAGRSVSTRPRPIGAPVTRSARCRRLTARRDGGNAHAHRLISGSRKRTPESTNPCESMIEIVRRNQRHVSTEPGRVQAGLVHRYRTGFPRSMRACLGWGGM
jgi:hypothetical protein